MALTRKQALEQARARQAEAIAREASITDLMADWIAAESAMNDTYRGLYGIGLSRSEIADRLGCQIAQVPRAEDLPAVADASAQEAGHA